MEQMELFETGDLQPIQKYLHVWSDADRAHKKTQCREAKGEGLPRQAGGGGIHAANTARKRIEIGAPT
jgi:hypothetical protein